jgi:primosomal protein N'
MQFYEVSPIGVIGGRQDLLTYSSVDVFSIGEVVIIPYGSRKKTGVIVAEVKKPKFKTKMIEKTTDDIVSSNLLSLALWMSDYYVARL